MSYLFWGIILLLILLLGVALTNHILKRTGGLVAYPAGILTSLLLATTMAVLLP